MLGRRVWSSRLWSVIIPAPGAAITRQSALPFEPLKFLPRTTNSGPPPSSGSRTGLTDVTTGRGGGGGHGCTDERFHGPDAPPTRPQQPVLAQAAVTREPLIV